MAAGFGLLAMAPQTFWSLTLKEIEAAIRGRLGIGRVASAPSRAEFATLHSLYPDTQGDPS